MDLTNLANKLDISESASVVRKAAELRRRCDVHFDSNIIGIGETCKAVICLEIAATRANAMFDRRAAVRLSGISEKAYNRSFNALQNGLGLKNKLDIRELGIKFGCVRLIPFVQKGLTLFNERFLESLPASRRATADFTRPVFTAAAFYLCAKRHKLRVDKLKLIELCGASESEFSCISTSMLDLCHDVFGISKEKKDSSDVRGARERIDALPEKRKFDNGGDLTDNEEVSSYKKHKKMNKAEYEEWKSSVLTSNKSNESKVPCKRITQTRLGFVNVKKVPGTQKLKAI